MSDVRQPRAFYEADSLSTEIYDVRAESVIAGSPMDGDLAFYRHLADETGGPVLDVGCGTGRVASAIERVIRATLGQGPPKDCRSVRRRRHLVQRIKVAG